MLPYASATSVGTVGLLEVLWTLFGVTGLYITAVNLYRAARRRRVVITLGVNGDVETLARAHVTVASLLVLYCCVNIAVGVSAMFQEQTTSGITIVGILVTTGMFLGQCIVIAVSVVTRRLALKLRAST